MRETVNGRTDGGATNSEAPATTTHGGEPQFLFSSHYAGIGPSTRQASVERFLGAAGFHLVGLLLIFLVLRYTPAGSMISSPMESIPFHEIVWLDKPGPGGGGGGGGNRMQAPPRKAELPGKDKLTVPVAKPEPMPVPQMKPADAPPPALDIPAKTTADAALVVPGSIDGLGSSLSQGPGSGGGYGTGTGTGVGPGNGSGLGPGWGGGYGGGAYHPGSGIESPQLIHEVKPQYTADAMRAKIQGSVILECIVLPDGSVGDLRIIKSLDPVFGLDQEAIKAARQWRFRAGRRHDTGQLVPVLVNIQLDFNLR
jgi:periplasmic protein TonB